MIVTLPWPDKDLSPNARVHHHQKASAVKAYRNGAGWLAMAALRNSGALVKADGLHLFITFHPPNNRRRDLDNMLSSIKAGLDGLAGAIGVDDSTWGLTIRKGAVDPKKRGFVRIEIGNQTTVEAIEIRGAIS